MTLIPEKEGLMLKPSNGRTERYINARFSTKSGPSSTYLVGNQTPANKAELVFLEQSPDYCFADPKQDIKGTSGRECFSEDQCYDLCCGRGWQIIHEWQSERCNCKLNFTTHYVVECQTCTKLVQRLYCR